MNRIALSAGVTCVALLSLWGGSAWAGEASPGWEIFSRAIPSNFSSHPATGFPDGYTVVVRNAGSRPTDGSPITITDTLPGGVSPTSVVGYDLGPGFDTLFVSQQAPVALNCVLKLHAVTCTDEHAVPAGDSLEIGITVSVSPGLPEGEPVTNTATVEGGGAPSQTTSLSTMVQAAAVPFGLESMALQPVGLDGAEDTQAGDHPYEFTTTFYLNTREASREFPGAVSPEDIKDVVADLPAGFVGNPQVVQKCSQALAASAPEPGKPQCPASSQIGIARLDIRGLSHDPLASEQAVPVYNVVPDKGAAADFEFYDAAPVTLSVTVSHETNYAVRVTASGIPRAAELSSSSVTFFGEPATAPDIYNHSVGALPLAFLQSPVNCAAGPLQAKISIDSWQHPGSYLPDGSPDLSDPNWKSYTTTVYPAITGCAVLQFEPSITVTPSTTQADEPTGVNVNLRVPQASDRFGEPATPELQNATVTLPAGMSVSPSAADGLGACSDAQIGLESIEAGNCPNSSVLGTVKVDVPLLETPLEGQVFLGEPECGTGGICGPADAADGRMLRLFIEAAGSGVRLKKEGRVYLNPSTGQLTTKFEDNPQDPFENLELDFKAGLRAGLATPQTCGQATTTTDLVPWSTPVTPDATPTSSFGVSADGNGGACPTTPPLNPSFSVGTSNPNAGQFSPFTLTFGREDREQDLSGIEVHMPPGLLGTLTGVPLCGEPQAASGTCSSESEIGSMTVAAGPGSHPFYEHGEIYLTGPYKGAPFGLSIVVPTIAGPFNLGNVVVRAQIDIDPLTTALTVTSDPFPQVIDGIPLRLRTANVTVDRPGFIFNPTNCALQHITATIAGAQGAQAQVSAPFAVSGCAGLHFGPTFRVSTSGKTSKADGASLDARLTFPTGPQSNVAKVKVDLPIRLPSRLTTLQKACPAAQFSVNPAGCPAASVVGIAKAITPLLPVPLTGPAYFVSHGGEAFPNLIVVLQGYGVRVDLIGDTFISKKGITSSTFANVPDVQVSSFELYLPEGPYSALAANGNLCKGKLEMPTLFTAQDGAEIKQDTPIAVTGCHKTATKNAKKASRAKDADSAKDAYRTAARAPTTAVRTSRGSAQ